LTRNKDVIFAHVVSCDSRDEISNCIWSADELLRCRLIVIYPNKNAQKG
jgi:hypothetical protein